MLLKKICCEKLQARVIHRRQKFRGRWRLDEMKNPWTVCVARANVWTSGVAFLSRSFACRLPTRQFVETLALETPLVRKFLMYWSPSEKFYLALPRLYSETISLGDGVNLPDVASEMCDDWNQLLHNSPPSSSQPIIALWRRHLQ